MELLDLSKKDGTTNSDVAFYGNTAYVGNYDGFRIIDISDPSNLEVRSDFTCRANQGDLSVFRSKNGRRYLLQSIDRPVSAPDCTGTDTPLVAEDERGVSKNRARFGYEGTESDRLKLTCETPHRKISVGSIPLADPEAGRVRTGALSEDTEPYVPTARTAPQAAAPAAPSRRAPLSRCRRATTIRSSCRAGSS